MTIRSASLSPTLTPRPCAGTPFARRARGRPARAPRPARGQRLAAACLLLALGVTVDAAQARKSRPPKAASAPTTAQILAPSAATVPDPLPPEQAIYRCGNSYSARRCAPAQQPLALADARTAAQQRQSQALTARDKRLAEWYEAGRRERETAPSAPARGKPASAAPACVSTSTMTCVPRKPRSRTVKLPGGSSPAWRADGRD